MAKAHLGEEKVRRAELSLWIRKELAVCLSFINSVKKVMKLEISCQAMVRKVLWADLYLPHPHQTPMLEA